MGYDDARTIQLRQVLNHGVLADVVECRGGLVEEEHLGFTDQRPGDEDALPLSARHAFTVGGNLGVHTQGHVADVAVEGCHACCLPGIIIRQQRIVEEDVVADGTLNELSVLHADANTISPQAAQVDIAQVVLVVEDGARERFLQSQHQAHQRAFATARGADQGYVVAAIDAQVESVEEHGHIVGIAKLQASNVHPARDLLHHMRSLPDLGRGTDNGLAELQLGQQARHDLDDALQLEDGSTHDAQDGTIGDVVGERQAIVPGGPHRDDHGQELQAVADAVDIEAGQRLVAAVHLGRCVCLGPLVEGAELGPARLDFLHAREEREQRTYEVRAGVVDAELHFHRIIEHECNEEQLYGDHGDPGIEQGTPVEEELHEHEGREQESQDGREEIGRQVGTDARHR